MSKIIFTEELGLAIQNKDINEVSRLAGGNFNATIGLVIGGCVNWEQNTTILNIAAKDFVENADANDTSFLHSLLMKGAHYNYNSSLISDFSYALRIGHHKNIDALIRLGLDINKFESGVWSTSIGYAMFFVTNPMQGVTTSQNLWEILFWLSRGLQLSNFASPLPASEELAVWGQRSAFESLYDSWLFSHPMSRLIKLKQEAIKAGIAWDAPFLEGTPLAFVESLERTCVELWGNFIDGKLLIELLQTLTGQQWEQELGINPHVISLLRGREESISKMSELEVINELRSAATEACSKATAAPAAAAAASPFDCASQLSEAYMQDAEESLKSIFKNYVDNSFLQMQRSVKQGNATKASSNSSSSAVNVESAPSQAQADDAGGGKVSPSPNPEPLPRPEDHVLELAKFNLGGESSAFDAELS